jgi:predicted adenylyl cyclase CyaB
MNRNVEIKARVDDLASIRDRVRMLADDSPRVLVQEDTFFACPRGRCKMRQVAGTGQAELIYYERLNQKGPKESHYIVHRTPDGDGLKGVLAQALGVRGVVRKRRELFVIGQTRVHLDEVEGLGTFVELEVVLRPDQSASEGTVVANHLTEQLGIRPDQLIDKAYFDLLEEDRRDRKG